MPDEGTYIRLPRDIEEEIGGVVVQWAFIEAAASTTLYDFLKIGPKQGRLCFPKQSPDRCVEAIMSLAKLHKRTIDIDVKILRKNLESFGSWRNAIVHGVWTPKKGVRGPTLLLMRSEVPEARVKPKPFLLTARALRAFNSKLRRVAEMVEEFHREVLGKPREGTKIELLDPMPLRLQQAPSH